MNGKELLDYFDATVGTMRDTIAKKNHDYTAGKGDHDAFANFNVVEVYGIDAEAGFITRMSDKMQRIASFRKLGFLKVKTESVVDSLLDLANYCIIMAAFLSEKMNGQKIGNYEVTYQANEKRAQPRPYRTNEGGRKSSPGDASRNVVAAAPDNQKRRGRRKKVDGGAK